MVARQQHTGNPHAAEIRGARVLRVFEQTIVEALVDGAALVAQHARNQAHHGVDDHHGRKLSRREHVIAQRNALIGECIGALVDALVMPANEQQAVFLGKLGGNALVERLATGREEDGIGCAALRDDIVIRLKDGLALHHQALAAAVRVVVGGAMAIVRPIAQVVRVEIERARCLRALHDRLAHNRIVHMRERGKRIDAHGTTPPPLPTYQPNRPAGPCRSRPRLRRYRQ